MKNKRMRGQNYPYPIKLLYTSNIPLILLTVFISNLYYISAVLNQKFKGSYIAGFFGKWENDIIIGQSAPVGGLMYYLSPPRYNLDIFRDPFQFIIYCAFVLGTCAFFSRIWIHVSG